MIYPVSQSFLAALRTGHTALTRVEVWYGGAVVIPDLAISGGSVSMDGAPGGVRSTLSLTSARDTADVLWDLLAPTGTELRPYRGIRYIDGSTEWVPLGVFVVDSQKMGYGPDGTIELTAPDRYAQVQRTRFLSPTTTNGGAVTEAIRLAVGAVPVAATNTATSAATTKAQVWDRDRDQAIDELTKAAAAELFFDRAGLIVARNIPKLANAGVWNIGAGESGVMVAADRERDRSRTFSVVIAICEATDGAAPFSPQFAFDLDTTSPTYCAGPFGYVPTWISSPLFTTAAQALAAAKAVLVRASGLAAQVTLDAAVNPALDPGDVITVVFPGGKVERHLIDTLTIPLDVGTPQKITTRSTRPEGDVPA